MPSALTVLSRPSAESQQAEPVHGVESSVAHHAARISALQRLRRSLARSPYAELRAVAVQLVDQSVCMNGIVSSYYLKQVAQETLRQAGTSLPIRNGLDVRPAGPLR
ncbi:MAG: hypothetical protein KDA61_19540 [Planctomycetales bacterium]|nr:hypothetical protein [Planctomycetales bacterium]